MTPREPEDLTPFAHAYIKSGSAVVRAEYTQSRAVAQPITTPSQTQEDLGIPQVIKIKVAKKEHIKVKPEQAVKQGDILAVLPNPETVAKLNNQITALQQKKADTELKIQTSNQQHTANLTAAQAEFEIPPSLLSQHQNQLATLTTQLQEARDELEKLQKLQPYGVIAANDLTAQQSKVQNLQASITREQTNHQNRLKSLRTAHQEQQATKLRSLTQSHQNEAQTLQQSLQQTENQLQAVQL